MNIQNTPLNDLKIINFNIFKDERGFFVEKYNKNEFKKLNLSTKWVQDNFSYSKKNVLRGLHYQIGKFSQTKIINCVKGEILDVAVDIRKSSPTFGQYFSIKLTETNNKSLYIPIGFAHGFSVLSDEAYICYKVDNFYNKDNEKSINLLDPDLSINWQISDFIISNKDKFAMSFQEYKINPDFL